MKKLSRQSFALWVAGAVLVLVVGISRADFAKDVGAVKPGPVAPMTQGQPLKVPFITWGGDMATFYANGGLKTVPGTLFAQQGLNLELTPGDDFVQQVKDYVSGKTPFLRGTMGMIGMASQVIGSNEETKGVVFVQMTWSLGDHMVGRKEFKNLNDLKGKTICLQQGGPHVGFLFELLDTAKLTWDDIKVVWAKDLTGSKDSPDNNPAAMFRKNPKIDACFCISPDMISLCGDREKVGDAKVPGQVDGAHVVVSTFDMRRAIADVYVCRKDFYAANKDLVNKFVYGYLKACEDVGELFTAHDEKKGNPKQEAEYQKLLKLTQSIYGKETIPTLDDAHGLLADCEFVNFNGNAIFFLRGENYTTGFEALQKKSLEYAQALEYIVRGIPLAKVEWSDAAPFDTLKKYMKNADVGRLEAIPGQRDPHDVGTKVLYSFSIFFEPDLTEFSAKVYGRHFKRVGEMAAKFPGCMIQVRGHADPTKVLLEVVQAGQKLGTLKANRNGAEVDYTFNGAPFDLKNTKRVIELVGADTFEKATDEKGNIISPRQTMQGTQFLSQQRAEQVKQSMLEFAKSRGMFVSESQFVVSGAGISEPEVPMPRNDDDAQKNRRVEFQLLQGKRFEASKVGGNK